MATPARWLGLLLWLVAFHSSPAIALDTQQLADDLRSPCAPKQSQATCNQALSDRLGTPHEPQACTAQQHPIRCLAGLRGYFHWQQADPIVTQLLKRRIDCQQTRAVIDLILAHTQLPSQPIIDELESLLSRDAQCGLRLLQAAEPSQYTAIIATLDRFNLQALFTPYLQQPQALALSQNLWLKRHYDNELRLCNHRNHFRLHLNDTIDHPDQQVADLFISAGAKRGQRLRFISYQRQFKPAGYGLYPMVLSYRVLHDEQARSAFRQQDHQCYLAAKTYDHSRDDGFYGQRSLEPQSVDFQQLNALLATHKLQAKNTPQCQAPLRISRFDHPRGDHFYYAYSGCREWMGEGVRADESHLLFRWQAGQTLAPMCRDQACVSPDRYLDSWSLDAMSPEDPSLLARDMDRDGHPEVQISVSAGVSAYSAVFELMPGYSRKITDIAYHSEGEDSAYPESKRRAVMKDPYINRQPYRPPY